ncbi:MAG: ferrous iron transport protein B [Gemmatimonadaceae bacterium]
MTTTQGDRSTVPSAPTAPLRVALVGNPNTGKTTLFNALTGMRQRVGNFAGVTVERVEGSYRDDTGREVSVLDLPGSYSLSAHSPDEAIALDILMGRAKEYPVPDVLVVVVDVLNIERNLFLTSQLLELGLPTVIALNQYDIAESEGIRVDVVELINELGATVIPTVAKSGLGVDHLRRAISMAPSLPRPERRFALPREVTPALAPVERALVRSGLSPQAAGMEALLHLSTPTSDHGPEVDATLDEARRLLAASGVRAESLEAELRYGWITEVVDRTVSHPTRHARSTSDRVDAILLHRLWGPVIFLLLMGVVFQAVFSWAAPFQGWIEHSLGWMGDGVTRLLPDGDLRSLIVDGMIGGVGAVLAFLPQIAILFLFLGILEDSGYMARAAFIMDRYMRRVGLHGRSFIPLLSGYACAVPAIMSTRTIEKPRDRLATIMVVPLMSCSARLPIYTLLIGAFIPAIGLAGGVLSLKALTMLGMYLLGTIAAFLVAAVFRKTLLRGQVTPLILELPPYRVPSIRSLAQTVMNRAAIFLKQAGTIILAVSIVLWAMASYPETEPAPGMTPAAAQEAQLTHSLIGRAGHAIEPLVRPLGFDWKIGVGIVSSFAAREVFVSTMGTIYGVGSDDGSEAGLTQRLRSERDAQGNPVYTTTTALALMVFYVFAMMCMSTMAVVYRETGGGAKGAGWMMLQFTYMLVLAYGGAMIVRVAGRSLGWG